MHLPTLYWSSSGCKAQRLAKPSALAPRNPWVGESSSLLQGLLELVELVLDLPHLLVAQSLLLLAVLKLFLQVLDLLLLVLVGQRCVLVDLDLVARAVEHLVRALVAVILLIDTHGLALNAQAAALHDPLLGGHAIAELLVVRDDQHTALVVLDAH